MNETERAADLLGDHWVREARYALRADAMLAAEAQWFRGAIRMSVGHRRVLVVFGKDGPILRDARPGDEFRFGFAGDTLAWSTMLNDPCYSLNRSVRSAEILLEGDRVDLMKWWRLAFLLVEALSVRPTAGIEPGPASNAG